MTKEEKYINARLTSKLYITLQKIPEKVKFTKEYVESELLIKWSFANNNLKEQNNKMRTLIAEKRNNTIDEELNTIFEEKNLQKGIMTDIENQLHIPTDKTSSKAEKEKYVLTRTSFLLFRFHTDLDEETMQSINWLSASDKLKKINKMLSEQYAISQAKGFSYVAENIATLREQKNFYEKERNDTAAILNKIAMQNNIKENPFCIKNAKHKTH